MVHLFVANTDIEWFDFLAAQPNLKEANFWRPSPQQFHSIEPGELFAFRLKSPRDRIGGFGVLSSSVVLPLLVAWESFGIANGAASFEKLRTSIAQYRQSDNVGPATSIGCRVLVEPMFFPPDLWFELPPSWSRNIVVGSASRPTSQKVSASGINSKKQRRHRRPVPPLASPKPLLVSARRR